MKRLLNNAILLAVLVLAVAGCRKSDPAISDSGAAGKDWFRNLKKSTLSPFSIENDNYKDISALSAALSQRKLNGAGGFDGPSPIAGTYHTGSDVLNFSGNPNQAVFVESFKSNVFVISPEMGLNIYPGAILNGNSIYADVFAPTALQGVSGNIRPVNLSTSLPVSSSVVAKTLMARPSASNAFLRTALTDLEANNPGKTGAARLQFEMTSFSNYAMVKALYGYNKNINLFLYKNNGNTSEGTQGVTRNTGFILKFFQQNFTIDVDVPSDYSELFDPSGLDTAAVFGGRSPYYVSSVTYGRMGIMTIESSSDSATVYNAITKQIGILQGLVGAGTSMTDAETRIINEAEIRYAITGPGGDTNTLRAITSAADFVQVLGDQATYSMDAPGVPISFRLRYLVDDTNVEAPFQINYGPFDKPYARVEYRNFHSSSQENSDNSRRDQASSDVSIVCYPTQNCIAGTEIVPLNFITFNWQSYTQSAYGTKDNRVQNDYYGQGTDRNAKKNSVLLLGGYNRLIVNNLIGPEDRIELYRIDYSLIAGKGYFELPTKTN